MSRRIELLKIIIFNVGRGFCAFVKSPNKYSMLIDCACSETFSPILYILKNELSDVQEFKERKLAHFILSHPHDDHLSDQERLISKLPPWIITGMKNDLEDVKDPEVPNEQYVNLNAYAKWRGSYTDPVKEWPDWGMDMSHNFGLSNDAAKKISKDPKQWANNASKPVVIEYGGNKIFFSGDLMTEAWENLLEKTSFKGKIQKTKFFVVSHHGLKSGYNKKLYEVFKPLVNFVSEKKNEEVYNVYSQEDHAEGILFNGETRYMVSTRTGSIILELYENGAYRVTQKDFPDNIS